MRMKAKKILPILLAAVIVVAMLPFIEARAASDPGNYIFDVSDGSITVGAGTIGGTLKVTYGASQTLDNIPASQNITITGTTTSNTVTVSSGVTANITLSGASVDVSGVSDFACAFNMTGATVSLTLADGTSNTLKSGIHYAGLQVPAGAALAIDGSGTLTVPSKHGAGIGGGDWSAGISSDGGTVTIMGGTITASSYGGAGIGGGLRGVGGTVTITGGTVTALSHDMGAGIGGGWDKAGGTVTITGGTVTARGINWGAGIGGGANATGGTVTITGGIVGASSYLGAGIGGGYQNRGTGYTVTITGGSVTASGGSGGGAGIGGGGNRGDGGTVIITGGSVKASSANAESIGHGQDGTDSGTLTNGSGTNVYLTTVTLSGVSAKTTVSLLTTSLGYTYGINDMQTDADGKLYLYLPENTKTTAAQTSAASYIGEITTTADHNAAGTLEMCPATYTISYNANGGSGTMADATATQGVAFTLPPNGFIAPDGKQFKEWAIGDAATGAKVAAGDSYTFTAPTTVYAVWEDTTLPTVTGVTPDGTGTPVSGNIAITFSVAMDTAVAGAVYLSNDGGTTYGSALTGGSWSAGDTVYTIPYSGLSYSTAYTVKIEGFQDAAGNTMVADSTHSFTTCAEPLVPSVSPGTLIVDKGGTASFTVAFGQGGAAATDAAITVGNSSTASVSRTQVTTPGSVTVTGLAVGTTDITVVFNDTASTTATVSITVRAVAPTWPSGSSLTASGVTSTGATLTWTAAQDVTAVTSYKLYQDGTELASVAGDVYSHTVTGLLPATSYTFQVQAGNADGEWTMNGPAVTVQTQSSGSSGGGSSSTPSKPTYTAIVKTHNRADATLPVTVNADTGSAAVNMGVQQGNTISGGENVTVIMPSIPGVSSYSLGIPVACLTIPGGGSLTFDTDTASITIPSGMLAGIPGTEEKTAGITIAQGDKSGLPEEVKAAVGDRPLVKLTLTLDGKQTEWNNPDAPVTVSIPYTPTAAELADPEHIVAWYIDGSGNVVSVPNGRYDAATGTVSFFATHFSDYAVTYVHKTFSDLGSAEWARKAIEAMASKGITNGTDDGTTFSPGKNITRADFMVLLIKTLGLTAEFTGNFDDVKPDAYYYNAVGIARKLGIAAGCGNNLFKPAESISRQDMMVLAARALEKYQVLETAESSTILERFSDGKEIAEYAVQSLATLIEAGLVEGSGGRLTPRANTTRAEAAAFLYKIYNKYPQAPVMTASTLTRLAGQSRIDTALAAAKAVIPIK